MVSIVAALPQNVHRHVISAFSSSATVRRSLSPVITGDFVFLAMAIVNESHTDSFLLSLVTDASALRLISVAINAKPFESSSVEKYVSRKSKVSSEVLKIGILPL